MRQLWPFLSRTKKKQFIKALREVARDFRRRKRQTMMSKNVVLSQSVSNPVGTGENTDQGEKINPPGNVTSRSVDIVPGVCNPVGHEGNTGEGRQKPIAARPIPS